MFIYKFTNKINNKVYIGLDTGTIEEARRYKDHKHSYKNVTRNSYFYKAIRKYGFENFSYEILENCENINDLNDKEIYWISYYNSTDKDCGYNILPGGRGYTFNDIKCDKTRETLIENRKKGSKKANKKRWGKLSPEERKEEIKHLHNENVNKKKSKSLKKYWENVSEEKKLSQQRALRARANKYKVIDPNGNIYIVDHIKSFAEKHGLDNKSLRMTALGQLKQTGGGWKAILLEKGKN